MTRRTLALSLCLLATSATPALAQSPVEAGYGETPVPPTPTCTTPSAGTPSTGPSSSTPGTACQTTPTPPPPAPPTPTPSCTSGSGFFNGSGSNGSCDENAVAGQERSQPADDSTVAGASDTQGTQKASDPKTATAPSKVAGDTAPVATKTVDSSGSLPFTGMDTGVIALMAAVLLGVGFVLRRATAPVRD